jgi:hypothetical protein
MSSSLLASARLAAEAGRLEEAFLLLTSKPSRSNAFILVLELARTVDGIAASDISSALLTCADRL